MGNCFLILKKNDRTGNFEWVEVASDFDTATIRLKQLSAEFSGEFVIFPDRSTQTVENSGEDRLLFST
jgi:hypothetical protein